MKLLSIISTRYLNYTNVSRCRTLFNLINPSRSRDLSNGGCANMCFSKVDFLLSKLCELLDCNQSKAEEIYAQLPKSKNIQVKCIEEQIKFLKQNGITTQRIMDNPWILFLFSKELKLRFQVLGRIGLENDTIPLLRISVYQLAIAADKWLYDKTIIFTKQNKFANRLQFLAGNLQCTGHQVAMQMDIHYPLLTMDFERLQRILHLLLESGITEEQIKRDFWIFRHNECLIRERIKVVQDEEVNPIKTWMLRCPENTLRTTLKHRSDTKIVLGKHKDHESYLAERLMCNIEDIVELSAKFRPLLRINIPKVKAVLDFLFENGYTAAQVRHSPRIFGPSLKTLESRLDEFEKLGYRPLHLRELYTTEKEHKHCIDKIIKSRNF